MPNRGQWRFVDALVAPRDDIHHGGPSAEVTALPGAAGDPTGPTGGPIVPEHPAILIVVVVLVITHLGLAVLMATVTSRAAAGRLARNQWVGIRAPATMRSEAAWVAGHRAASRLTPLYGLNSVAASAVLVLGMLRGWSVGAEILVGILAFATFAFISVYAVVVAGRAAKSVVDE